MKKYYLLIALIFTAAVIYSCKKTISYQAVPLSAYAPYQVGQFITYRLDSTVYLNFGTQEKINSYMIKDVIEASATDNLGRPGWRVVRYITDTAGIAPWSPLETYLLIPTFNTLEIFENNLHYIKLVQPISANTNWHGNSYLPDNPLGDIYNFSGTDNENWSAWSFYYSSINTPETINGKNYDSVVTVLQVNDSTDNAAFKSKTFWQEKYAPHVGLVSQEIAMWEYQASYSVSNCYYVNCTLPVCDTIDCSRFPNSCDSISRLPIEDQRNWTKYCKDSVLTGYYYTGYGVKLTILEHN